MPERSSILYSMFSRWLLLCCILFGLLSQIKTILLLFSQFHYKGYTAENLKLFTSYSFIIEVSDLKTHEEIYGYVMYDFFMVNHFFRNFTKLNWGFMYSYNWLASTEIKFVWLFLVQTFKYQTSLSIVFVEVNFGQIWSQSCVYIFYTSCK
jgi:hypothetical protein